VNGSAQLRAGADGPALVIGLVNNMPDAALQATERQFRQLLESAADGRRLELHLIALPEVPRGAAALRIIERSYEGPDALRRLRFDGLIVTGTEPRSPRLDGEPYWGAFAALVDWAREHTASTVWSCLAAHAAVLHLDGIERRRYPQKLFGLFDCAARPGHELCAGLSAARRVPHSRFNDLPEESLRRAGYDILARADLVGADFFVKDAGSCFVFLQGHPEYDRLALLREYRRDLGRYLSGERDAPPALPHGYLTPAGCAQLEAFVERARTRRDPKLLIEFPKVDEECVERGAWRADATQIYENWFKLLEARRKPLVALA
jgi:homoserine O-succinyltransferase